MIIWKQPSPLTGGALLDALAERLRGRVQAAYVFGSHARGVATSDSDVDLVIVMDTDASFVDRGRAFFDLFDVLGALDLVVYTPTEWAKKRLEVESFGPLLEVPLAP